MKMKKGVSLIILIVTIIIIIILATTVILTLNKNNPIDSSKVAQLADSRASINSAIQLYYGKKMAETQGMFETKDVFLGNTLKNSAGEDVVLDSMIGPAISENSAYCEVNSETEKVLYLKFPTITNAKWYLDVNSGLVYLAYENRDSIPNWMFKTDDKKEMDSTLAQFVKIKTTGDSATLIDVKKLD